MKEFIEVITLQWDYSEFLSQSSELNSRLSLDAKRKYEKLHE